MTDHTPTTKLRAVALAALLVLSVLAGATTFTGAAAAAANAGPEAFQDQATDAGDLTPNETAVVQTIDARDADGGDDDADTVLTGLTLSGATSNTVSASNISEIEVLDGSGTSLGTTAPAAFTSPQQLDITNRTIPDDTTTELRVQATVAANATQSNATLALDTRASWVEGNTTGTTDPATDGAPETLAADTAPTDNETVSLDSVELDGSDTTNQTVVLTFNQPVVATDSGITAANVTYTDANDTGNRSVTAVRDLDGDTQVAVSVNESVTAADLGVDTVGVESGALRTTDSPPTTVSAASMAITADATTDTPPLVVVTPSTRTVNQSTDALDVAYRYNQPVSGGSADVTMALSAVNSTDGATFNISDSPLVANATQRLTLDLAENAPLADGAYTLSVTVDDGSGSPVTRTTDPVVVIDDEPPDVSAVSLNASTDVSPRDTVAVNYTYDDATNATSATVHFVAAADAGNFTAGNLANASAASVSKEIDMAPGKQRVDVNLRWVREVTDNSNYTVYVTATDERGLTNLNTSATPIIEGTVASATLDVNAAQPTLDGVETDTGSTTVTATFSERVAAVDGDPSPNEFVYQDATNDGAGAITAATASGPASIDLTLDSAVTTADIGTDAVSVRADAFTDTDDADPRAVPASSAVVADTTAPTVRSADAGPINNRTVSSYDVSITTGDEPVEAAVTLRGSGGTTRSKTAADVTGDATFTFDATALDRGAVDVTVTLTDAAENTVSTTKTVQKDTVVPTITTAAANPGASPDAGGKTRLVTVLFSEPVDGSSVSAQNLAITSDDYAIDDVLPEFLTADNEAVLLLNRSVAVDAIGSESVQVRAPGVTDTVGHPVANAAPLADTETTGTAAPEHTPGFKEVVAEPGATTLTVRFDEIVSAPDGSGLTAADFTFEDGNNASAGTITAATQLDPQTVEITLDEALTAADLVDDSLSVTADSVVDTSGNVMPAASTTFGIDLGLTTTTAGDTITLRVTTLNDIEAAVGNGLTVTEATRELASLEEFTLDDRFTATLSPDDFTEINAGVYEASVTVPHADGAVADGRYEVSGTVDGRVLSRTAEIDTTPPCPTDAVLHTVTSEAQPGDALNTTRVRVLFNEPIDAGDITPRDVSIDGFDGEIVAVQDGGLFGSVSVVVEGHIQTGTSPAVTIDGDSYTDRTGTQGATGASTVVHTDVLRLDRGQNYVSVPATSGAVPLSEIDTSAVDAIYAYDAAADAWDAYDPDARENSLTALEGGAGYVFVMDRASAVPVNVYNIAGAAAGADPSAPAPTAQSLSEGWNLVGQYRAFEQPVDTALSSVSEGAVYSVLAQDETADGVAFTSHSAGDFETMERSEGYWVFVREDEAYTAAPADN
ncbi:beta strand repeat-containing protein [Halobacterium sp. MBLA0001]|uniref:beta strand repeat-containing protein n=1 Tax=Halobacterium sp. MBLA0001 TaxID=3413511 RepID=UPI003C7359FE